MPLFQKIDCIMLKVSNLNDGLEFYSQKLGHELIWKTDKAAGLKLPNSDAELVISTENGPETDIKVEDTQITFDTLIKMGATSILEPFEIQIGKCAVVEDPWGNELVILDTSKGLLKTDNDKNVIGNGQPS
jgi:lactoylglutathione lyase